MSAKRPELDKLCACVCIFYWWANLVKWKADANILEQNHTPPAFETYFSTQPLDHFSFSNQAEQGIDIRYMVNTHNCVNNSQMDSRIHYIRFTVPVGQAVACPPCAHCGAHLYLRAKPSPSGASQERSRSPPRARNLTFV